MSGPTHPRDEDTHHPTHTDTVMITGDTLSLQIAYVCKVCVYQHSNDSLVLLLH